MLFMVIESFRPGKVREIYQRLDEKGRQMPEGLRYVNSWIEEGMTRCYQVMECDDPALLRVWMSRWDDLFDFEVIPVLTSAQARERALGGRPA